MMAEFCKTDSWKWSHIAYRHLTFSDENWSQEYICWFAFGTCVYWWSSWERGFALLYEFCCDDVYSVGWNGRKMIWWLDGAFWGVKTCASHMMTRKMSIVCSIAESRLHFSISDQESFHSFISLYVSSWHYNRLFVVEAYNSPHGCLLDKATY